MGVKASSWAWDVDLPPVQKLVLLAYADFANDVGTAWPAHDSVCKMTGASRRTVQRTLQEFEKDGLLIITQVEGRTNRVQLNLSFRSGSGEGGCQGDTPTHLGGCQGDTPLSTEGCHSYDTPGGCHGDTPPELGSVTAVTRGGVTAMTRGGCHSYDTRSTNNHQDPNSARATVEAATGSALDRCGAALHERRLMGERDDWYRKRLLLRIGSAEKAGQGGAA